MRQRMLLAAMLLVISLGFLYFSIPKYGNYLSAAKGLLDNEELINKNQKNITDFEKQRIMINGEKAPDDLMSVIKYISAYADKEIIEIKSFNISGDGVEYLGNVTSLNDTVVCDGFEVIIAVHDMMHFIEYIDSGNLTFHSADFLFGANTATLRIRVGGVNGQTDY